jgi:hypothetical protein
MSLKNIKQHSDIKIVGENLFEKSDALKTTRNKKTEEKKRRCVSVYLTDLEYEKLTREKGDVSRALFCRKIILEKINKIRV